MRKGFWGRNTQGFWRNGGHGEQAEADQTSKAVLWAGDNLDDEVELPNITLESGKAPGEQNQSGEYFLPDGVVQATNNFKLGLYKTTLVFETTYEGPLNFGVDKLDQELEGSWLVVDNFRLTYFGPDADKQAVIDIITGINDDIVKTAPTEKRIYTLQGIQVKKPVKSGIYIVNDKKVVVK